MSRFGKSGVLRWIAVVAFTAGCSSAQTPLPAMSGGVEQDVMTVAATDVTPGGTLAVHWPGGEMRGVGYYLGRMLDGEWRSEYVLVTGFGDRPGAWESHASDLSIPAAGREGPGPDLLQVPESAEASEYRICTWGQPWACVVVRVVEK